MADERDKIRAAREVLQSTASKTASTGTPFGQAPVTKAVPATISQAKALGFDSAKGITIQNGQFVFDKSLAPDRGGFQSVGVAKPGEVQMTPYFGDVTGSYRLNQEQFAGAYNLKDPSGLARIMQENEIKALVDSGMSLSDATAKVSAQYGEYGVPLVSGGGYDANGNVSTGGQYDSKGNFVGSSTGGTTGTGTSSVSKETQDAFAILKSALSNYGLETLYPVIEGYMKSGLGSEQAKLKIKTEPIYQARFAGNEKRRTAGLNVLSEAEYLALEDAYSQTLKAYGQQSYFGATRDARQTTMAELIGGDVSATEFKDRIDLASTRVANADPGIKAQLKSYYKIEEADLVGYFLNPKQNLPKLEEKVKAAEIGSAAALQSLGASMATAEDLAKFGVDLATARKGYAAIANVLPTAEKLGQIYSEEGVTYDQAAAEAETFKGLASAQRKRLQLAEKEIAAFSGQSGTSRVSLNNKTAGKF